jgi:DNA polymerase-3 subunit gamma/tau
VADKTENYEVMARKYRPTSFDDVVGQEHVASTLKNAISEKRIAHAYLFAGSRGVGKTSMARILAKALNCLGPNGKASEPTVKPCGQCEVCRMVHDGSDPDVIELDAASNRGIDDIKALRESVRYKPLRSRHKVYIIDEAHQLTKEASNALLKTLEEPPDKVIFVLATTEQHKLLDTIRSRCQIFEFHRITIADIAKRLRQICTGEKVTCDDAVLHGIARAAKGSMRDSEGILDQLVSYAGNKPTERHLLAMTGTLSSDKIFALIEAMRNGDAAAVFRLVGEVFAGGADTSAFLDQLVEMLRVLMVVKSCGPDAALTEQPADILQRCEEVAKGFSTETLVYYAQMVCETKRRLTFSTVNPRVTLELALVKLARVQEMTPLGEISDAIRRMESGTSGRPAGQVAEPAYGRKPQAPAPTPVFAAAPSKPAISTPQPAAPRIAPKPAVVDVPEEKTDTEQPEAAVCGDALEAIKSNWARILEKVRAIKPAAEAYLKEGRPIQVDGVELTIGIGRGRPFHIKNLQEPGKKKIIEDAIAEVTGKRLSIVISETKETALESEDMLEEAPMDEPSRGPSPSRGTPAEPTVRKVVDKFKGKIVRTDG